MLCAGVVHGDLSEFNILLAADGPVIIDLPQAVDAAGNNHAQRMLLRDVANLRDFFGRFAPELLATHYGDEIWALTSAACCNRRRRSRALFERAVAPVDVASVLREVNDSLADEASGCAGSRSRGHEPAFVRPVDHPPPTGATAAPRSFSAGSRHPSRDHGDRL